MKINLKSQKGVSMVESILYVAIIALLLQTFFSFSLSNNRAYVKTYVIEDVHTNLRHALNIMSDRIKKAKSINTAASIFDSDPGTLSIAMPNPLEDPTIFYLNQDDGVLYIDQGLGYPQAITTSDIYVANLAFKSLAEKGAQGVIIEVTAERRGDSNEYEYFQNVKTAVTLR